MRAAPGAQTAGGDIVLLEEQDRTLWDRGQIAEGLKLVEDALRMPGRPQSYAVQAAIAALHARAPNYRDTDWPQIAGLYEVLLRISPSPVIELNHAAAVSMVDGPARALDLIDALQARGGLDGYELLPAVRADLLRRLGRHDAAREAYLAATAATQLEPLRRLYARRMAEMDRKPCSRSVSAMSRHPRLLSRSKTWMPDKPGMTVQSGSPTPPRPPALRRQARQQRLQRGQRRMIGDAVDAGGAEVALEGGDHFHGRAVVFAVDRERRSRIGPAPAAGRGRRR